MKRSLLFLLILLTCCATSRIEINRPALKQVKRIAILPFTATVKIDRDIPVQAAEYFRNAFTMCGIEVVEQGRIDELLAKTGSGSQEITGDRLAEAGRVLGADAVLKGEITMHGEEPRIVKNHSFGRFGDMFTRDRTEWKTYLKFRITVELVGVPDGSVIMKMTNISPETEKDGELPCCGNIDSYRKYVLKNMSGEIVVEMTKKD